MSTQQDIYAAGSESRPPMLNKENYVSWSSRLLRYAKSRTNRKLIHNSIINGPYVRRMIPEPDDELTDMELKQIEADDQAIQTILLGLPEDIYAAVDSCETAQEIWLRIEVDDQAIQTILLGLPEVIYAAVDSCETAQEIWLRNYMQQPMPNPKDITDPTTAMNMALALMAKAFKLNYSTPTNNNQRISSNPRNMQIAQPGMNMGQDRQMQMVGGNSGNQFRNQNGLIDVPGNGNQNGNGIQLQAEEYDLMAAVADLDEIEEVNTNCILMANLQQASISGTQSDKAPVYDSDGSAEVHDYEICDDNEIFNMFTQEEQYTELLKPIPESHQVPQNDNNVISEATSVEKCGEIVEQHPANFEETHDTTPSVARKFLNEVKSTIVALQRVVKHRMTIKPPNWSSSSHQELHKIVKDKNFPIVNQVDARVQNFEIQFLKEAAKFVGDFKSLANEADASLAKHKALELEIEGLLKAVVSQDIINIVHKESVVDTSDLQTELERTKERFENCIIKKENEYAKLWNDWYKKCDECKYDKILYDKAYKDMQQKIEWLQAQLGDLKGKSQDTSCVSDTHNPLSPKLKSKNVVLEFQVLNYARENAHLKATYKNLFDSIYVSRTQTKTIIASLQNELQRTIYKNAKLRTQLFKKVPDQKDNTHDTSANTKSAK
nr:hypothetical protein [Tanacetum cinerariifolium]